MTICKILVPVSYLSKTFMYYMIPGRVWVFIAVCEGSLESYTRLFLEGQKEVKKFYAR